MKSLSFTSFITQFRWLYAPTPSSIIFSVRTSISALVGLYIAYAMQMESPYWAPITVWMVCVAAPEENSSKAFWLVIGTVFGGTAGIGMIAIFPQQPALFVLLVAFWVGGCCFCSSFLNNFRVHGMRISAITGALVALGSVNDPNQSFYVAMSRSSYVLLGVILQKVSYSLFIGNTHPTRVKWLQDQLRDTVDGTCLIFSNFFSGNQENLNKNRSIFTKIYHLNQQSEFVDLAAESHSHLGAHGRLVLAIANNILIKTFCLEQLSKTHPIAKDFGDLPQRLSNFFIELPNLVKSHQDTAGLAERFNKIKIGFSKKLEELSDVFFNSEYSDKKIIYEPFFTRCSIICDILAQIELMFLHFQQHLTYPQKTHYQINSYKNINKAMYTGMRIFLCIVISAIIWYITAWNLGPQFVLFICILSCIIYLTDFPQRVSIGFFIGTCLAVIFTAFINFILMPYAYNIEMLTFIILPFMLGSGLAVYSGITPINTVAYNIFFFVLIQFNNQHVIDELTYFNMSLCILSAAAFMVVTTYIIFPFSNTHECIVASRQIINDVHKLTHRYRSIPSDQKWIDTQSSNIAYLLQNINKLTQEGQSIYFYGALSTIFIGAHVIQLRSFLKENKNIPHELNELIYALINKIRKVYKDEHYIDHEYNQLLHYMDTMKDVELEKKLIPVLCSVSIIKSQLYNHVRFIKFFKQLHYKQEA